MNQTDHNYATNEPPQKKKKRNTNFCCVPQCATYGKPGISLHLFPKNPSMKTKWEIALRMGKPVSSAMKVCSRHFLVSDYFRNNPERNKLFPHAVPSQNIPKRTHERKETSPRRQQRLDRAKRAEKHGLNQIHKSENVINAVTESLTAEPALPTPSHHHMTVSVQANLVDSRETHPQGRSFADILSEQGSLEKCTQVNLLPEWQGNVPTSIPKILNLSDLLISNEYLFAFTGIHSINLLEGLVSCVAEIALEATTNKIKLSVKDRVILTMVKIKQNMSFTAIGILFGINRQTCSNYFKNMCPMLARVLKVVIPWPDREMIRCNLPKSFSNYKNTRVILDCAETTIEKCKCLKCRILTYSQYKKNQTTKFNVAITPSGLITDISSPYGGRASDKHIVNESGILDKCEYHDGVMVDKGYRIDAECQQRHLQLIRPPFLSKKKQLTKEEALQTAEIARARVHVERVIQRLRQYKFVCGPVPWPLTPYFEDILNIVAGLTNLGPPVIHIDKFL